MSTETRLGPEAEGRARRATGDEEGSMYRGEQQLGRARLDDAAKTQKEVLR